MSKYNHARNLFIGLTIAFCLDTAHAESPGTLFAEAVEQGKLPSWANAGSRLELKYHGLRVIACLEDRERTRRWVTWGYWDDYLNWTLTGRWKFRDPEPVPPEYFAICGFPLPGPVALGEPAYWSIVCVGGCKDNVVNWTLTNRSDNIAGPTIKGEPCGAPHGDSPAGWYELPRLHHSAGQRALTRCE